MAGTTAATRCTVTRCRAVFMRRVRRGGEGSATFALASVVTTIVNARAFLFVVGRFMAGTTAATRCTIAS